MLRIRLTRVGKKKQPAYRIVVADSRSPRDGAFLKIIGHYNPRTEPVTLVVKEEEAVHWLEKGARPSDTAAKLLTRLGVMEKAGRAPVRYVGKEVAPVERAKKGAPPEATAPASVAVAEPEPIAETQAAEAETEAAAEVEAEADASEPEPAAEDQPEEPAEAQE